MPLSDSTKKSLVVFALLSVAIAIIDALFVLINYYSAARNLEKHFLQQGERFRSAFELSLLSTGTSMQQIATYVANDNAVKALLSDGMRSVAEEGGGPGGEAAARHRQQLLALVSASWNEMQARFDLRHLHFHLAPDATSFLRVHSPQHYGDRLDSIRFTVVRALSEGVPAVGPELGRFSLGIRGVVPVVHRSADREAVEVIGAVDAGTSFSIMLEGLKERMDADFTVLLSSHLLRETVRPELWAQMLESRPVADGYVFEASSSAGIVRLWPTLREITPWSQPGVTWFEVDGVHLAATHFPLRDFKGQRDQRREPVGIVLVWTYADEELGAFHEGVAINILYGVAAFAMIQLLIVVSWRLVHRRLELLVAARTKRLRKEVQQRQDTERQLQQAVAKLERLAALDALTGLANRRTFDDYYRTEWRRASRLYAPISVLLCDVDYFKGYNDTYGHQAGDDCLKQVAAAFRDLVHRSTDMVARYGGEEFIVVLPDTDKRGAAMLAEQVRGRVERLAMPNSASPHYGVVTVSVGVASVSPELAMDAAGLIKRADRALYQAKAAGRNGVAVAGSAEQE